MCYLMKSISINLNNELSREKCKGSVESCEFLRQKKLASKSLYKFSTASALSCCVFFAFQVGTSFIYVHFAVCFRFAVTYVNMV